MFTGIVEELGHVDRITDTGDAVRLTLTCPQVAADLGRGDSIAVNGCCLTAAEPDSDGFTADVMRETLERSNLGRLSAGDEINLERAMRATGRFDGHIVQGHVDGTGSVTERTASEHWEVVRIALDPSLGSYLVHKGSVTVDGVSLTVVDIGDDHTWFTVSLIPTTLTETTLGQRPVGSAVNLEIDILAKYVERLLSGGHLGDRQ